MIGWAADAYGLGEPAYTVDFDEAANQLRVHVLISPR